MPSYQEKNTNLSENESAERISILKRFRQLLVEQRDRFRRYLDVLDKQKMVINEGNVEELAVHVELEERIVEDIFLIQKSIEPMRDLYETVWKGTSIAEIPELTETLENLKIETARRINENKELLQSRMTVLRNEIKNLRSNPFARKRSVYDGVQASLLDIKG
jgi:hypothetical protein